MELDYVFNEIRSINKRMNTLSKKVISLESSLDNMRHLDKDGHTNLPTFTGYDGNDDLIDLCNILRKNLTHKVGSDWWATLDMSDSGLFGHPFCSFDVFDSKNNWIAERVDNKNKTVWVYNINSFEAPKVFNILKGFCKVVGITFKTENQTKFEKDNL